MTPQKFSGIFFICVITFFYSCNPNILDDNSNYWNSTTLSRNQLKGSVKTVTYNTNDTCVDEYNQDGFIIKSVQTTTNGISTTIYNYSSLGVLSCIDYVSTIGGINRSYTTTFEYQSVGKYVPQDSLGWTANLIPNLKAIITPTGRTDYIFKGDSMLLIHTNICEGSILKDTSVINYVGKYPVSTTTRTSYVDNVTYAEKGMFLTYTEGRNETGHSEIRKYSFIPDVNLQLIDSVDYTVTHLTNTTHTVQKYTYDSTKNIIGIRETSQNLNEMEVTYEYDSHNNWTSKTVKYKDFGATDWQSTTTTTREITYW